MYEARNFVRIVKGLCTACSGRFILYTAFWTSLNRDIKYTEAMYLHCIYIYIYSITYLVLSLGYIKPSLTFGWAHRDLKICITNDTHQILIFCKYCCHSAVLRNVSILGVESVAILYHCWFIYCWWEEQKGIRREEHEGTESMKKRKTTDKGRSKKTQTGLISAELFSILCVKCFVPSTG
jgi:hypothetical protein